MKKINKTSINLFIRLLAFSMMAFIMAMPSAKANQQSSLFEEPSPLEGRWDITMTDAAGKEFPAWLEVRHSGFHTLIGEAVIIVGSARPISRVHFQDGKLSFAIPPQWEEGTDDLVIEGELKNNQLTGTMVSSDGKKFNWVGSKAPSLKRSKEPVWDKPIKLFNGTDLKGWNAMGDNQWKAEGGLLRSPKSGANLVTKQKFNDFKLHIEFRIPAESNSGVYLRGRYETQIADSKGMETLKDYFGAIYGFIAPSEMVAKSPGEWQSFDITLVGRKITLIANGKMVICNQEIPGITGGALDSHEGEAGPILLQGDHGPVDFRNIVITPAK